MTTNLLFQGNTKNVWTRRTCLFYTIQMVDSERFQRDSRGLFATLNSNTIVCAQNGKTYKIVNKKIYIENRTKLFVLIYWTHPVPSVVVLQSCTLCCQTIFLFLVKCSFWSLRMRFRIHWLNWALQSWTQSSSIITYVHQAKLHQ